MSYFKAAKWDILLQVITAFISLIAVIFIIYNPSPTPILIGGGILVGAAIFMVRGYTLDNSTLIIHRLGWTTEYDLTNIQKVEVTPGAMKKSLRTFGIGGLFGWIGRFSNSQLGSYRAYATNRNKCVVIRLEEITLVVTPEAPSEFVDRLTNKI